VFDLIGFVILRNKESLFLKYLDFAQDDIANTKCFDARFARAFPNLKTRKDRSL
jgi:hypothetical protein